MNLLHRAAIIMFVLLLVRKTYQILENPPEYGDITISVLEQVDRSVNPCDDFYQYSCSNASHLFKVIRVLSELSERRTLELYNEPISRNDHYMVQMVKKLFHACMDLPAIEADDVKTIKDVLDKLGGWPMLQGNNWNSDKFNWLDATYKLRDFGYMFPVFLDVLVDTDREDSIEVSLPRAHYYVVGNSSEVTAYMLKVATAFGASGQHVLEDIEDIAEFGEELQDFIDTYAESKPVGSKMKVGEYQKTYESIDWIIFINKIISPAVHVSKRDIVTFPNAGDLKLWLDKIENVPKRVQANYMLWKVVEQIISYLGTDLQRYKHQGKRSDFCLKEIERRYTINPISIMYLRKYLPKVKKMQVEHLVSNLKTELMLLIKRFDWLSADEQKIAIDKATNLKLILGLPGNCFQDDMLNQLNVDMKPIDKESFLELLAQANRNYEGQKYTGVTKKLGFSGRHYLINYEPNRNTLYVPAALLNPPLYDENRPNYLNYGNIGLLIGGELSGLFQTKNTNNSSGKYQFANSTIAGLEKMKQCVLGDYDSQVFASETDVTTVRTIQEYVIAQHVAYEAYTKWAAINGGEPILMDASYTTKQLFWISTVFCDPKSKSGTEKSIQRQFADFRVYTALRNHPYFGKDFNCPTGTRMNPANKCRIF